ncbi:hypothetical protein [Inquilinus sp. Marseille-Q2685]|uniref:hypothetical protein n=1 Tax=Inquilinus sp. Marseille-Q2685 TaxID=2866581 RepID=UPI001CE47FA1|nr:hypothetical protein [Inquilinus sp. Marseille-Q2685]
MTAIRSIFACTVLLSACGGGVPPSAPPDPAVAARVRSLSGDDPCSDAFAGVLTAFRIPPNNLTGFVLPTVAHDHPGLPLLRQAWFKLSSGGSLVLGYDADQCWVTDVNARDGAVLPTAA